MFSDIEGSTQRWERDRSAMQEALQRHDALVRTAIETHHGHVFKTVGDAFCAAFARTKDAMAAAIAAQRALNSHDFSAVGDLPVRMALHCGSADEREGDYFGPTLNRVARLLAIGHGGQVLVSGVTADLVRGEMPAQATLLDLGTHRLKDLAVPERVYQLGAPGLRDGFAPLQSVDSFPNNLPPALTSFVGREREVAEITELLATRRLVTLVGSGGIGKTRTSLHVAANLIEHWVDGSWLIELAPLSSGEYIPSALAQVLGVTLSGEGAPLQNLARALKRKQALLIFDNCEHLVESVAHVVVTLLRECPKVKVLASSRQALAIEGEEAYRLPSLNEGASLALFAERAERRRQAIRHQRQQRSRCCGDRPQTGRNTTRHRTGRGAREDPQPSSAVGSP